MPSARAATQAQARPRAFAPQRHAGAIVAAIATLLTAMAVLFIDVGSAVRASVGGEGLWSKAQKQAVLALVAYADEGDEARWQAYRAAIAVPLSARRALNALAGPTVDEAAARDGFLGTGVDPADVDGVVRLFRWGRSLPAVDEAMRAWTEADRLITVLDGRAQALRVAVGGDAPAARREALRGEVLRIDAEIAPVTRHFSEVLERTDRQLRRVFTAAMVVGASALSLLVWLWLARSQRLADMHEHALRESEARRTRVLRGSCDGYFEWRLDRRDVHLSPRFAELLGHRVTDADGFSADLRSLLHPEDRPAIRAAWRRHRTGGAPIDLDLRLRQHDGQWRWFGVRASILRAADGDARWLSGSISDISARRAAERALKEAHDELETRVAERTRELREANDRLRDLDRLKSDFVATMNHELRTPLNAVLGFTSLILDGHSGPLTDRQRDQLGHVRRAGQHLLALINDVLDVSRLDAGRTKLVPEDVDLAALVREAAGQLQPAAAAKGLALVQSVPPALALRADRRRVMQVLLNLGGNALKFTAAGRVRLFAHGEDGGVAFGVEDTGVGVPADRLGELFEPFRQLDNAPSGVSEGTGLGLYLSRRLVEGMGGRIEVRSTIGVGSCFTVHLPAAPQDGAG